MRSSMLLLASAGLLCAATATADIPNEPPKKGGCAIASPAGAAPLPAVLMAAALVALSRRRRAR